MVIKLPLQGPSTVTVSREVELLYEKFNSCWCNEVIEVFCVIDLIHHLPLILEVSDDYRGGTA